MYYHLVVTLPVYLLISIGLAGLFKKAGKPMWAAFIPVYNWMVWLDLVGRPKWHLVWLLLPIANFIVGIGIALDLVRSYGKHTFGAHFAAVVFPFIYFPIIGWDKTTKYEGKWSELAPEYKANRKKSEVREWLDAILFAGMAAILIRTFFIEAFMIPTTSMEGSLLAGDFLFVSKFHYGIRMPMVPVSVPFVHNTMPFTTGTKSYWDGITLPYSRLPALTSIQRNQVVVFNYPDDDRNADVPALGTVKPISMKQNYIKRCVGVPGDSLKIINRDLYINDGTGWKRAWEAKDVQYEYYVEDPRTTMPNVNVVPKNDNQTPWKPNKEKWRKLGLRADHDNTNSNVIGYGPYAWLAYLSADKVQSLKNQFPSMVFTPQIDSIPTDPVKLAKMREQLLSMKRDTINGRKNIPFPKAPELYLWTQDNFGPIWIPKKGATAPLNKMTYPFFEKIISVYEGHTLEIKGDQYIIDGQLATTYTFELDYYWMMGDNRNGSLDSRFWGYVPETHVVGKPWMVLFSWEGGPRWNRFFSPVSRWEP